MLSYHIDPNEGIVELVGPEPNAAELEELLAAIVSDPLFQSGFGFLRDRCGMPPMSLTAVQDRLQMLQRRPDLARGRWAIVIDADPFQDAIMKSMRGSAGGGSAEVEIFSDYEEARRWLLERGSGLSVGSHTSNAGRQLVTRAQLVEWLRAVLEADDNFAGTAPPLLELIPKPSMVDGVNWWVDSVPESLNTKQQQAIQQAVRAAQERFDVDWQIPLGSQEV